MLRDEIGVLAQPVACALDLDHDGMVEQAIEQCGCNDGIAEHLAPIIARAPSARLSTPDEVAEAVLFLAGDAAANIHAATLSVDGGWAAV